eukprot:COSAG02_NODE_7884_length_2804_cov_4.795933_2_plen_44_part_00
MLEHSACASLVSSDERMWNSELQFVTGAMRIGNALRPAQLSEE